jgi:hypothetical protein
MVGDPVGDTSGFPEFRRRCGINVMSASLNFDCM